MALLLLVVFFPGLLGQAGSHFGWLQERRALELQANLELARSVAATFDAYIRDIIHQELAIGLALTSPQPVSVEQANRLLAAGAAAYPSIYHYSWVNPQGRVIASSTIEAVGLEVGDLPFFREIVAGREWVVSDLFPSRLPRAEPVFCVARGIRDEEGTLQGVVV
ncbi:MAG TPA: cache domain-containing protein, partial [Dehalococcoidia bacterium]|nr:cache domain-containing protein [Dehalococcoidia bacterium]